MAEEYKDIDNLFREKLEKHAVSPSPMVWRKLQGRLDQRKTPAATWVKIAASLLLLLGLSALLWLNVGQSNEEPTSVAKNEPTPAAIQEYPTDEVTPLLEETVDAQEPPVQMASENGNPMTAKRNVAVATPAERVPLRESNPVVMVEEIKEIELPPLDPELAIAETIIAKEVPDEVTYKVTIISNGIINAPEKTTLVGEIENKIDKIGGFVGKVDQGLADLQDAKNNLFAGITTKK